MPTTVCARSPAGVDAALELVGGCPAIVKLQQGTQGIGTMIAETPQAVHSLLETLWAMGQDIVLQEYIARVEGARHPRHRRRRPRRRRRCAASAKTGEFRSNLHRGGKGDGVKLPRAYRNAAIRAAKVDGPRGRRRRHARGRDGPKILEINSSPGLEGIERASGVDVAGAIIEHAEKYAVAAAPHHQREARPAHHERDPRRAHAAARERAGVERARARGDVLSRTGRAVHVERAAATRSS